MALDDLELTSLTSLHWEQKLVSSVRLMLASGIIDYAIPAHDDGTLYDDAELQALVKEPFNAFIGPPYSLRRSDGLPEKTLEDFSGAQVRMVRSLQKEFADPSRVNAILAVIFTELGWPVIKIGRILQTSRPTLNRWVMTHANTPVSQSEADRISAGLEHVQLFMDLRTMQARSRRSTALWKKAVFLPPVDIVPILSALWRVSYRTRGERSGADELMCSYTLDMFIDLLLRRGVTGLNIGKIVNVSHAAVLLREHRSDTNLGLGERAASEPDGLNGVFRHVKSGLVEMDLSKVDETDNFLYSFTKTDYRNDAENHAVVFLQVRTGKPTERHPIPSPNVSVLCSPTVGLIDDFKALDGVPLYDVAKVLDSRTDENYAPVYVEGTQVERDEALNRNVLHLVDGYADPDLHGLEVYQAQAPASLYDVHRYGYHGIASFEHWKGESVMSEALLCQATATYNRDLNKMGRPVFGQTSYHAIPAEVQARIISIVPASRADAQIQSLREIAEDPSQLHDGDSSRELSKSLVDDALEAFLSTWHLHVLRMLLAEATAKDGDVEDSLLYRCIYRPNEIIEEYPAPRKRGRTSRED